MNNDLLTVIVPVYNARQYLCKCVESILKQSYSNLEVFLVDDGSTDGSAELCDDYAKADQRVNALHIENGGPSIARNTGIRKCSGRYLAFVDADDSIAPDYYQTLIAQMKKYDVDMAVSSWICLDEKNETTSVDIGYDGVYDAKTIKKSILFDDTVAGGGYPWNRVVDYARIKSRAGRHILYPERIHAYEDKCWVIEVLQFCGKVCITPYDGYRYLIRSNSLSRMLSPEKMQQVIAAWYYIIDLLKFSNEYSEETNLRMHSRIMGAISWLRKNDKNIAKLEWEKCKQFFGTSTESLKVFVRTVLFDITL